MTALPYPIRGVKLNLESLFTRVMDGSGRGESNSAFCTYARFIAYHYQRLSLVNKGMIIANSLHYIILSR